MKMEKSHDIIINRNKRTVSTYFIILFSILIMNSITSNRKIHSVKNYVKSLIDLRVSIVNSLKNLFLITIRCWVAIWFVNLYIAMKLNIFSTYYKTNLYSNCHTVALSIEISPRHPYLRRQQDNSSIKKYIRMLGCISFNDKQGRNNYAKRIPCRLQCTLLSIVLNIHTLTHIRKFSSVVSNWYAVKLPPNPHSLIYNG